MWAKHIQSEIEMAKRNTTRASSNIAFIDWYRNLLPEIKIYYQILPDCNPNDQENLISSNIEQLSQKIGRWNPNEREK